jgi:hypothetical protein
MKTFIFQARANGLTAPTRAAVLLKLFAKWLKSQGLIVTSINVFETEVRKNEPSDSSH